MIALEDFDQRLDCLLEDALVKRILESVFRDERNEGILAAHLAELEVLLPSLVVILAVEVEELEGEDLGQGVIDVVERRGEDVALGQPARRGALRRL